MQEGGQFWQELLVVYKKQIIFALIGILCVSAAILISKKESFKSSEVQVLSSTPNTNLKLRAEIAGAVSNPGVYTLSPDSRVEDLVNAAGGLTENANTELIGKTINRAAIIKDGQKVYIPSIDEQSNVLSATNTGGGSEGSADQNVQVSGSVNINSASQKELEYLWGIGPVTAQKIIEQRPYSDTSELLSKKIVKQNVYDRIKDQITAY